MSISQDIFVFNKRRFGFKAQRTHRGWKATPTSDFQYPAVCTRITQMIGGSGILPRFPFYLNRNAAIGRRMPFFR
jgi:hypothetical protein